MTSIYLPQSGLSLGLELMLLASYKVSEMATMKSVSELVFPQAPRPALYKVTNRHVRERSPTYVVHIFPPKAAFGAGTRLQKVCLTEITRDAYGHKLTFSREVASLYLVWLCCRGGTYKRGKSDDRENGVCELHDDDFVEHRMNWVNDNVFVDLNEILAKKKER